MKLFFNLALLLLIGRFPLEATAESASGSMKVGDSSIEIQDAIGLLGQRRFSGGKRTFTNDVVQIYLYRRQLSGAEKQAVIDSKQGRPKYDGFITLTFAPATSQASFDKLQEASISFARREGGLKFNHRSSVLQVAAKRAFGELAPEDVKVGGTKAVGKEVSLSWKFAKQSFGQNLSADIQVSTALNKNPRAE